MEINFFKEQGDKFAAAKKFPEAIESYTKAIEFYPSLCQLYSSRSGIYLKSGKYNEALQDANKAIEIHPMWPEGYFRKGSAFSSMGKYADALSALSDGLKHDPTNDAILQGIKEVHLLISSSTTSKSNEDENLLKNPKQARKPKRISLDTYRKRTLKKQYDSENDKNDTPGFETMEGHKCAMDVQSNPSETCQQNMTNPREGHQIPLIKILNSMQNNPKAVEKKTEILSPKRRTKETLKENVMLKVEYSQNSESEIPSVQQLLIKMKNSLEAVVKDNALIRKELKEVKEENDIMKNELKEVKEENNVFARNADIMKNELKEVKEENNVFARNADIMKNELKQLKDDNIAINDAVMLLKEESEMLSERLDNFLRMQR